MKEIGDIINSFQKAVAESKRCALATVVHVEGSSYRRPGARMLVTEDGQLTGAISGGCLEGDALRKALLAINQQENKLVSYDSTNEDDAAFGVQLGCNGIVHILFEPIDPESPVHPLTLLIELQTRRADAVLVTGFSLEHATQPGTQMLYRPESKMGEAAGEVGRSSGDLGGQTDGKLAERAASVYRGERSVLESIDSTNAQYFFEFIQPAPRLIIAGAGNDVQPLVQMASMIGWECIVADGRHTHARANRFPLASKVVVARAEEAAELIDSDPRTALLLITHNYQYDKKLLALLNSREQSLFYIGLLGPKSKLDRVLGDLADEGIALQPDLLAKIHGPVGLDLGAETSAEIALSILSEIQLTLTGTEGQSLSVKKEAIHSRTKNQPV